MYYCCRGDRCESTNGLHYAVSDVMLVVSAGLFNCTTTSYPVAFRRLWATSRRSSEWYTAPEFSSYPCDCEPCGDSRSLLLTNNRISGSIPDALGRLSALQ
jgi:hypothetical protein